MICNLVFFCCQGSQVCSLAEPDLVFNGVFVSVVIKRGNRASINLTLLILIGFPLEAESLQLLYMVGRQQLNYCGHSMKCITS